MANDFKEMVRAGTDDKSANTKFNGVVANRMSPKTRAKSRFQPIEQIMSRFDTMDAVFAAA